VQQVLRKGEADEMETSAPSPAPAPAQAAPQTGIPTEELRAIRDTLARALAESES